MILTIGSKLVLMECNLYYMNISCCKTVVRIVGTVDPRIHNSFPDQLSARHRLEGAKVNAEPSSPTHISENTITKACMKQGTIPIYGYPSEMVNLSLYTQDKANLSHCLQLAVGFRQKIPKSTLVELTGWFPFV